jgi:hypothetical protein
MSGYVRGAVASDTPAPAKRATPRPHFNGPDYDPALDHDRLINQVDRIRALMLDGRWRTLYEIRILTGDPEASISAQLRHLRKPRFGSYLVDKRRRGKGKSGLFEYRLVAPEPQLDWVGP